MASKTETTLGFYTVEHNENAGWMGGYLLLNTNGRPLEFHCSLPLRPTRTQEVLYGSSLEPFLVGDLIGRAVINRAKLQADIVFTNQQLALELASWIKTPVACIGGQSATDDCQVVVDGFTIVTSPDRRNTVANICEQLPASLHLGEPFERIREAFGEARGASRAAA